MRAADPAPHTPGLYLGWIPSAKNPLRQESEMRKLNHTNHSMKMMWGCVAFAVIAIVLISSGVGAGALFIIPCMLMMGMMMWMMMGGMGGSGSGSGPTEK